VVARLLEVREAGTVDFDSAWAMVMEELPPPFPWAPRPALGRAEAPAMFLRRQCERAWRGEHTSHDLRSLAGD
jgi:hypothetical protein